MRDRGVVGTLGALESILLRRATQLAPLPPPFEAAGEPALQLSSAELLLPGKKLGLKRSGKPRRPLQYQHPLQYQPPAGPRSPRS